MREIVDIYKYNIEKIRDINWDMWEHVDICHKYSEICAAYPKQSTAHFEDVANITVDSASVITQEKKR